MPNKKPAETYLIDPSFEDIIRYYISREISFKAAIGKYSSFLDLPQLKEKYITRQVSKRVFMGYAMIQRDLKDPEIEVILSDMQETVDEADNSYYHNKAFVPRQYPQALLVDLNSAYLQCLYNFGLIGDQTFNYIKTFTKHERLVCVGLLAKKKEIYNIAKGELISVDEDVSKWRFIFNAIIQEINQIMKQCADKFSPYLFFWVDGIYFSDQSISAPVMEFFEKKGFPAKVEMLSDLSVVNKMTFVEIKFLNQEGKRKIFNIPLYDPYAGIKKRAKNVFGF